MIRADKPGQTVSATRFARLTGVSRERLRTWERRFGFPTPVRVAGGPRRYALADVPRVVAVRQAAEGGAPLTVAIAQASGAELAALPVAAFRSTVELAPVPVALLTGPAPLRLAWANAALRALAGAPVPGDLLPALERSPAGAALRAQFAGRSGATPLEHAAWEGERSPPSRAVAYRLPTGPGETPVVAVMATETTGERALRVQLAATEAELRRLRERAERHDRWLDALAAVAAQFQHEPGPGVVGVALDVLARQTGAIDTALASYVSGRLGLHASRRGLLGPCGLTVAGHPQLGRALRDVEAIWIAPAAATALGIPKGLHGAGVPVAVAGEVLGLLVLVFEEVEPHDADNRRLLAVISASVGFALLRDRLVRELAALSDPVPPASRFVRRASDAPPPGG